MMWNGNSPVITMGCNKMQPIVSISKKHSYFFKATVPDAVLM
jgi:hypothetical protein